VNYNTAEHLKSRVLACTDGVHFFNTNICASIILESGTGVYFEYQMPTLKKNLKTFLALKILSLNINSTV
jgi:hypothetical protein